jgi:hypothetical protein
VVRHVRPGGSVPAGEPVAALRADLARAGARAARPRSPPAAAASC